jgi:hypothetical protein
MSLGFSQRRAGFGRMERAGKPCRSELSNPERRLLFTVLRSAVQPESRSLHDALRLGREEL